MHVCLLHTRCRHSLAVLGAEPARTGGIRAPLTPNQVDPLAASIHLLLRIKCLCNDPCIESKGWCRRCQRPSRVRSGKAVAVVALGHARAGLQPCESTFSEERVEGRRPGPTRPRGVTF